MPDIDALSPHYNSKIPPFLVTFFNAVGARHKREETISLADLAKLIRGQQADAKNLLPWLKLARFGSLTTAKGSLRHDANVLAITGIEADYDGETMSVDEAVERLTKAGVEALVYTSPSHQPDQPRWRVLAPTSEPLAPAQRTQMLARLNGALGGVIDDESFTLSQSYYYGHLYECAEYRVEITEGEPLDLCDHLDVIAIGKSARHPTDSGNGPDQSLERADLDELDRRIVSGESLHPSIIRIVGKLAADGATKDMARSYIGALVAASSRAAEARQRWSEFEREIDYVYAKEARKEPAVPPTITEDDWICAKDWYGITPSEQQWTIDGLVPSRQVCLFSGHGAAGKSTIALHICAAHALGRMWLSFNAAPGPAFFIDAEDDLAVIHRRLIAVTEMYGVEMNTLGDLHILSLAGKDALLAVTDRNKLLQPTTLYHALLKRAELFRPRQIVLSSSANLYGGNEMDRAQVTQFIGLLTRLAIAADGSVILISHPSLTGMSNDSGISGSTSWHNAVRAQFYLKSLKDDGQNGQATSDMRLLEFKKSQYGPVEKSAPLKWRNGMFLPEASISDYEKAANDQKADQTFRTLMIKFLARGERVSPLESSPRNYAPRRFAKETEAQGLSIRHFKDAMDRAIAAGTVVIRMRGPASKQTSSIEFP
jgi:RecA-family ATPase